MNKLLRVAAVVLSMIACFVSGHVVADNGYGKQKVVYHINYDNPKAQAGALRNIQNHINAVGAENLDLKVGKTYYTYAKVQKKANLKEI